MCSDPGSRFAWKKPADIASVADVVLRDVQA
jgi:hypothetical protein